MIGVGVKNSTSDLLIANCDEFIYYDDLVREQKTRAAPRRRAETRAGGGAPAKGTGRSRAVPAAEPAALPDPASLSDTTALPEPTATADEAPSQEAIDLVRETYDALVSERGAEEKIWGSMVKQALKRRKPGFSEGYYGFSSFNKLLEEAQARHQLVLERDEKSGGYIVRAVQD